MGLFVFSAAFLDMSSSLGLDEIFSPGTFDTKTALSGLYLWLLFGFLSTMVSCDLQRWMRDSLPFRHLVGIIAFFFLFTILDSGNKAPVIALWVKTLFIYGLFLMMVKSKWYFSIPVLIVLVIDQSVKMHSEYLDKHLGAKEEVKNMEFVRQILNYVIIGLVVVGFGHYMLRQMAEFGDDFHMGTFLFSYGCGHLNEAAPSLADSIKRVVKKK